MPPTEEATARAKTPATPEASQTVAGGRQRRPPEHASRITYAPRQGCQRCCLPAPLPGCVRWGLRIDPGGRPRRPPATLCDASGVAAARNRTRRATYKERRPFGPPFFVANAIGISRWSRTPVPARSRTARPAPLRPARCCGRAASPADRRTANRPPASPEASARAPGSGRR
jgi:hypothetical protein